MAIDKRYQVFISSTFRDLVEERQAVLKAVLELSHMPAGMELFPAADETAWQLIRDVIDNSDYYVLIVGGRYGSLDETGLGYTEKEYDYAISLKKPVIPLLHENPNNLPRDKTETDEGAWKKLQAFRRKIEKRHTRVLWSSAEELKARVIVGLTSTMKRHPAVGWIPADQVPSGTTLADILRLRTRVAELKNELERTRSEPPPGTEDLLQGEDSFQISFAFSARAPGERLYGETFSAKFFPTWNDIFAGVAPQMINEAAELKLRAAFRDHLSQMALEEFRKDKDLKGKTLGQFRFRERDIDTCLIQLRALGLIRESDRRRSLRDTSTYWTLTPYGDRLMVQLRALRKFPPEHRRKAGTAKQAPRGEEGA